MISHLSVLPLWAAIPAALLVVIGATLTLLGTIGLVNLRDFYDRLHAPTLGTSWGTGGIVLCAIIMFSFIESRFVIHAIVIGIFVMITTPVTLMVLGRSALQRDRSEGRPDLPPSVVVDPTTGLFRRVVPAPEDEAPMVEDAPEVEEEETSPHGTGHQYPA